jgi:hypothetical protein
MAGFIGKQPIVEQGLKHLFSHLPIRAYQEVPLLASQQKVISM